MAPGRLENHVYFHGIRTKDDVEPELKKVGDFLVRSEQYNNRTDIIIDVLGETGVTNQLIAIIVRDGKPKYCLDSSKSSKARLEFDSVPELVTFYRLIELPGCGTSLRSDVPKPAWMIKHESIKYDSQVDKLGSGNFCDVFKGKYSDRDNLTVAIKVCRRETQDDNDQKTQETEASVLREAKLMHNYNHQNIIKLFGAACYQMPVLLVMEFCPGGALVDHLLNYGEIPTTELILYCYEVARGLRYLHQHPQQCIHRDLATRNCLISLSGEIKIADFGLSIVSNETPKNDLNKMRHIPIRWMSPECLSRKPIYSTASDVWSFGVLVYEVFNKGIAPWADDKIFKAMAKRICAFDMPKFPKDTPKVIQKLVADKIWIEHETRIGIDNVFTTLSGLLIENLHLFPDPKDLTINKIDGVYRKQIVSDGNEAPLVKEKASPKSPNKAKSRKSHKCQTRKSINMQSSMKNLNSGEQTRTDSQNQTTTTDSNRPPVKRKEKSKNLPIRRQKSVYDPNR